MKYLCNFIMLNTCYILLYLLLPHSNYCEVSKTVNQDLTGVWFVKNEKHGYHLSANVPGGLYSDLMRHNIIGDVFYKDNYKTSLWVSEIDWHYNYTFDVDATLFNRENINLVFDGVDTFSTVFVNNVTVGSTNNMFVQYVFDVKPHLKLNDVNTIDVKFESPIKVAKSLFDKQNKNYEVPPVCVPKSYDGVCHVNHIRKMQSSFSWDWGPAIPSVGIWKKVYLEAYNSTIIRSVIVNITPYRDVWQIELITYFAGNVQNGTYGTLTVKLVTEILTYTFMFNKLHLKINEHGEMVIIKNISIQQSYVKLWWPNGYGEANLYPLEVSFINAEKSEETTKTVKIGFRKVELIQNSLVKGRTFYFKINNIPIFAKGSNSIPISILPELGKNETTIRFLLQSAKDANMNMLRVWGGGVYESDKYYEIADELGLTIWQDFMFACSMYPTNDDFLKTVAEEVRHQIKRLHYHPSIIIWSGNNENEAALQQNWYNTKNNFSLYKEDYIKLYVNTIRKELLLIEKTRPYLTSSPTNGKKTEEDGYISDNPQSKFYGDVHFYNYIVDGWQTSTYPISRFTSEFGYQSLPSISTILTATNDSHDIKLDSKFLLSRQHHLMGYSEMILLMSYQFNLPNSTTTNYSNAIIFYSQVYQAMAIKIETEYYRQWRSNLNDNGEGLTMGALYWQLNDVWVAPTWSGIDFCNKWKMLHYYAKNFFAPIIITGNITIDKKLNIYLVSDKLFPVHDAVINIQIFKWNSFVPAHNQSILTTILPGMAQKLSPNSLKLSNNFMQDYCHLLQDCFIYLTVSNKDNNTVTPDNFIFLTSLKMATLPIATIKIIDIKKTVSDSVFDIEIESNAIALFVWLEAKDLKGRFSDNGFLQITQKKIVQFRTETIIDENSLYKSLTITHLMDTQYL